MPRPKTAAKDRLVTVTALVPQPVKADLTREADQTGTTVSECVRRRLAPVAPPKTVTATVFGQAVKDVRLRLLTGATDVEALIKQIDSTVAQIKEAAQKAAKQLRNSAAELE